MTLSVLDKNFPGVAKGSNATVTFTVPVGQYWLIQDMHVSTGLQTPLTAGFPRCGVYIGAVPTQPNQVDFTYLGNNDSTGLLSASVIQPGDTLTVVWDQVNMNDTVNVHVYGVTSDTPPTSDIVPVEPAFAFKGGLQTAIVTANPGTDGGVGTFAELVAPQIGSVFTVQPTATLALQDHPNNNAPINSASVAAGGVITVVSAGSNLYLHTFQYDIDPLTNTTASWQLEDTNGNVICYLHFEGVSTSNDPVRNPIDFKGLPNTVLTGVQLRNTSGAASSIFGTLTYSK